MHRRLTYLEGFRDALETLVSYLRRARGCIDAVKLVEALDRALISVEEEIRLYKSKMHPISTLLEELAHAVEKNCSPKSTEIANC